MSNDTLITQLKNHFDQIGYQQDEVEDVMVLGKIRLKILDQQRDGVEVWLIAGEESIRVDFLLEYYLTQGVEMTNRYLRKEKNTLAFYSNFLKQFYDKLASIASSPADYVDWFTKAEKQLGDIQELLN